MKIKFDVTVSEFEIIKNILEKHLMPSHKAWVFGSRAKNSALFNSDLDIALDCQEKMNFTVLANIKTDFEKSKLPYEVDVIDLNAVKHYFKELIEKDMISFPLSVKSNTPALRFPEFSDNWVEKKLGDVGECIGGGTPDTSIKGYWQGITPWISSSDVLSDSIHQLTKTRFISKEAIKQSATKLIPKGSILMVSRVGIGKFCVADEPLCTSQDFTNFITDEDEYFLAYQFIAKVNKFINLSQGTSIKGFTIKEIKLLKFPFPTLPEQQKIASFLSSTDRKISALTKKVALLKQYKKGVSQQLFSQKIRFKADDGSDYPDWVEKKLGGVATIKRGASPRPITDPKWFDNSSKVGWVRISDVTKSKKYLHKTEQYLSIKGIEKSRLVESNNIIMSICATIGKPIYTSFNVCIHDGFVVFDNLQTGKEFLYYFLENHRSKWYKYGQPGTQINLNSDIVSSEKLNVPTLPEQQKIASFLSAIDKQIEQVSKQLEQSILFKKALLQQMFV